MNTRNKRPKTVLSALTTFISVLVMLVAVGFAFGLFFKIKVIEVEGAEKSPSAHIIEASGIQPGENIFLIHKFAAIREIIAGHPYVREVKVRRKLPGTVVIQVVESAPVGYIENLGSYWIFDEEGKLLEASPVRPSFTVVRGVTLLTPLTGTKLALPEADATKGDSMLEVLSVLSRRELLNQVAELDMTLVSDIRFLYTDLYTVALGTATDLDVKLDFLPEVVATLDKGVAGTIDLSEATQKKARFILKN